MQRNGRAVAHLWTIVLAAGDGTRLQSLTRALHGEALPKQFAILQGQRSLLETTLLRTAELTPPERTVVVAQAEREGLARTRVTGFPGIDVIAQPMNLGTGPGLLLPLARVISRDPEAIVVVTPSDHYVQDVTPFIESVRRAEAVARSGSVVLLGAVPDGPETQYGWIVGSPDECPDSHRVCRFEEKPAARVAEALFDSGALWNTFVIVAQARVLWDLAGEHLPSQTANLNCLRGTSFANDVLRDLYARMAPADFSRDVLQNARKLRVVRLSRCGWSDWGTPERVIDSLRGTSDLEILLERLNGRPGAWLHRSPPESRDERLPGHVNGVVRRARAQELRELGLEPSSHGHLVPAE